MFEKETGSQKDFDGFWDELIEKSNWAKQNAGKFSNEFKNLKILESKPAKMDKSSEKVDINKAQKLNHEKNLIAISVFIIIIWCLLIVIILSMFPLKDDFYLLIKNLHVKLL